MHDEPPTSHWEIPRTPSGVYNIAATTLASVASETHEAVSVAPVNSVDQVSSTLPSDLAPCNLDRELPPTYPNLTTNVTKQIRVEIQAPTTLDSVTSKAPALAIRAEFADQVGVASSGLPSDSVPGESHWEIPRTPPTNAASVTIANLHAEMVPSAISQVEGKPAALSSHQTISQTQQTQEAFDSAATTTESDAASIALRQEVVVTSAHPLLGSWEIPRTPPPAVHISTASPHTVTKPSNGQTLSKLLPVQRVGSPKPTPSPDVSQPLATISSLHRTRAEPLHYECVQLSPKKGALFTPTRARVPLHPLCFTSSAKHLPTRDHISSKPAALLMAEKIRDAAISPPVLSM